MSINWQKLRTWEGDQRLAFEELCCQLAEYEQAPAGSKFIRKGAPDAGVECYWELPEGGGEWGWQAKFFLSPPTKKQWSQIDESVKRALEKHPRLTKYTICLPIDRPDPRVDKQKSFMDKWNEHVEKWKSWALEKNMLVEFPYWGEHEIFERLSRDEHSGRFFFWFNEEFFHQRWFKDRVEEAISNAGPRYSPEFNVELPIAGLFDGLGRTSAFYNRIKKMYGQINEIYSQALPRKKFEDPEALFDSLRGGMKRLLSLVNNIDQSKMEQIDFCPIGELILENRTLVMECYRSLKKSDDERTDADKEGFEYERRSLQELVINLSDLESFIKSPEASLANVSSLLLVGKAGTGKTHLFCDVARQRTSSGMPTVLLLGQQFTNTEPWSQIINLLGLSCTKEEFLGALQAYAQAKKSRAIILIDALNEGDGKFLWEKHIGGILTTLSRYSWIGIALSVKSSYEDLVIPGGLIPDKLIRAEHGGFAQHEYKATKTFFDYFGIERPNVPLLVPEFQNPLFLKVLCQGLKNQGLTRIPTGLNGINAVFDFFVESINKQLSRPDKLDFDPKDQVVKKAIDKITELMVEKNTRWLERSEVQDAVNNLLPHDGYEDSLFRHMISEGVIAEDGRLVTKNEWCEIVHFSYERFTDHLIAKHYLDKYLDPDNPSKSFLPERPLGSLLKDENTCRQNQGRIEAFSIQLPERIKKELVEVAPWCVGCQSIQKAFIESIIWRDSKAFSDATLKYINEHIIQNEDMHILFLDALLTIASNPIHPYNAGLLHEHLMRFGLAERDAWWSIFLHREYGKHGAVDRLVEWAWSSEDKGHIDDDSIRLCGITLAWFLTTSNRYLRDCATKALVSMLTNRIHILRDIIYTFLNVNDLYILERLFAAAYGCAMRSTNNEEIGKLAKDIYEWIFKNGKPIPHILLRDYARNVIELALYRGIELDIDIKKIRPPYSSEWPVYRIPTEKELEKYGKWKKDLPEKEVGLLILYRSVMRDGDFARYIIGTNFPHSFFEWASRRLNEPMKPSWEEISANFEHSLTPRQKKEWERYNNILFKLANYYANERIKDEGPSENDISWKELMREFVSATQSFKKSLGKKKLKIFEEYIENPDRSKHETEFDLSIAQRWIFQRVLDLGWTVDRFGRFDRTIAHGMGEFKSERIGEKYQWLAYHEFLARVSDNFTFRTDKWSDHPDKYEGPWQIRHGRNIDPSNTLKKTERQEVESHRKTWWSPFSYEKWDSELDDISWLKDSADLPDFKALIEVNNPVENSNWFVLEAFYLWMQPSPPGEDDLFKKKKKEIWYMLKSYIVKKPDMDELFEWARKQHFMGRWMPESHELTGVFLGEFFWSSAFKYKHHDRLYYNHEGWTRQSERDDRQIPKEVLVATDQYMQEFGGEDYSIDDTIKIYLPAKLIAESMKLHWNGVEGHFSDEKNNLIAFDPSVKESGPGALLINRDAFIKFLNDNGYDILWTIIGEKRFIGGMGIDDNRKGSIEISGAYRIQDGKINGSFIPKFISQD